MSSHARSADSGEALLVEPHPLGASAAVLAAHTLRAGTRVGAWATDYGPLNRVVSLWQHAAVAGAEEADRPDDWLHPRAFVRRLQPRRTLRHDLLSSPCLELRTYATHEGRCEAFLDALGAALPARERYSPCVGLWKSSERGCELAVHLWAYESVDHRMAARSEAARDPEWAAYRAAIRPLLANMQAWLLLPLAGNP